MIIRNLYVFGILFLTTLISLASAGLEIPNCNDKTSNTSCSDATDATVKSYCINGQNIIALKEDSSPLCYIKLENEGDHFVKLNGKTLENIDFVNNAINPTNDLPKMAVLSCYKTPENTVNCGQTSAIIRDKNFKYYGISKKASVTNTELDVNNESCEGNIGKLIKVKVRVKLCLTETTAIPLLAALGAQNNYMIDGHLGENSPFDIDNENNGVFIRPEKNYYIGEITKVFENAYVNYDTRMVTETYYYYKYLNKYHLCSNSKCEGKNEIPTGTFLYTTRFEAGIIHKGDILIFTDNKDGTISISTQFKNEMMAFKFSGTYDVGVKIEDEQFLDGTLNEAIVNGSIKIFNCFEERCEATVGFIKYKDSTSNTIKVAGCGMGNNKDICETSVTVNCDRVQTAYYYEAGDQFVYCSRTTVNGKSEGIAFVNNNEPSIYLERFGTGSQYRFLLSDKSSNIIGVARRYGAVIYNNTKYLCYNNNKNVFYDTLSDVSYYADNNCSIFSTVYGYHLYSLGDSNLLISCGNNESCTVVEANNGYFVGGMSNTGRHLIKCSESICSYINQEKVNFSDACNNKSDGEVFIISANNSVGFCYNGQPITFNDKNVVKYYTISNINARATYPNIRAGYDTIFLEVGRFSVKQSTTDSNGICYEDEGQGVSSDSIYSGISCIKNLEPSKLGDYIINFCSSICKSCTTLPIDNEDYSNSIPPATCRGFIDPRDDEVVIDEDTSGSGSGTSGSGSGSGTSGSGSGSDTSGSGSGSGTSGSGSGSGTSGSGSGSDTSGSGSGSGTSGSGSGSGNSGSGSGSGTSGSGSGSGTSGSGSGSGTSGSGSGSGTSGSGSGSGTSGSGSGSGTSGSGSGSGTSGSGSGSGTSGSVLDTITEAGVYVTVGNSKLVSVSDLASTTEAITSSTGIKVYYCTAQVNGCTELVGYIKDIINGSGGSKLYYINSSGSNIVEPTEVSTSTTCTGNIGKLIKVKGKSNVYLCLTADKNIDIANDGEYLLSGIASSGNAFTDSTSVINLPIKINGSTIVLDKIIDDELYRVYETNALQDRKSNFCSGTILDNRYTCKNGSCTKEASPVSNGKYLVNNKVYDCSLDTGETDKISCTQDTNENGILIFEEISETRSCEYKYLKNVSAITETNISKSLIYDCKDGSCAATSGVTTYGSNIPVYCTSSECTTITNSVELSTVSGKLVYSSGFQLANSKGKVFDIDTSAVKMYLYVNTGFVLLKTISGVVGVTLPSNVSDGDYYINNTSYVVVQSSECNSNKITKYTISSGAISSTSVCSGGTTPSADCATVDTKNSKNCPIGYYIANKSTGVKGSGVLFHCVDGTHCNIINSESEEKIKIGYYKNSDPEVDATGYIQCGISGSCTVVKANAAANCKSIPIGGLYFDSDDKNKIKLCLKTGAAVDGIDITTTGQYIISINNENIFGNAAGKNVIIDFDGVNVYKNVVDTIIYRYTDTNQKVYGKYNNEGICSNPSSILEFKKDDSNFTYTSTD